MLSNAEKPQHRGFTLIELLVSIAILGVIFAIALPSYQRWIQNSRIRTASESIMYSLQKARAEAVSRNTPIALQLGNGTTFWSLLDGATVIDSAPLSDLPASVTLVSNPTTPATVTFDSRGIVAALNADGTPRIDQIDLSASLSETRALRITIGAGGTVRMCDPHVTDTDDPRIC